VQVQAISKSGTNNLSGAVYGFFRDDKFNAPDPVANQVLPYSNQQTGFAIGGPVRKDRLHYFFTYEHENNPATVFTQPPQLGGASYTASSPTRQNSFLVRGDWQISPRDSLSVRTSHWSLTNPFSLSSQTFPSLASILAPHSTNAAATWSRVFSNTRVGQLLIGYNHFLSSTLPQPGVFGQPQFDFPGATMGAPFNYPSIEGTHTYQFRYNQTWTRTKHELKFGGEFLKGHDTGTAYYSAFGRMTFSVRRSGLLAAVDGVGGPPNAAERMSGSSSFAVTSIRVPRGNESGCSNQYRRDQSARVFNRIIGARDPSGRMATICSEMFGGTSSGLTATACTSSVSVRLNVTSFASFAGAPGEASAKVSSS